MDIREGQPIKLQFGTWSCDMDGVYSVVSVDMSLIHTLPRKDLPELVRLSTPFMRPSPSGMPYPEELDYILNIEAAFAEAFRERHKAVFVGHIYRGGAYEGYF